MSVRQDKDSDQPGNPPSLIRVFAVRVKKACVLSYPFSAQRRLWSDWADAQADLSLRRWAHMPFCWFCHEAAHFDSTHGTHLGSRISDLLHWRTLSVGEFGSRNSGALHSGRFRWSLAELRPPTLLGVGRTMPGCNKGKNNQDYMCNRKGEKSN